MSPKAAANTWVISIVIALISLIVSGYTGYSKNDKSVAQRITAVEIKEQDTASRLERMDTKLDTLLTEIYTNRANQQTISDLLSAIKAAQHPVVINRVPNRSVPPPPPATLPTDPR